MLSLSLSPIALQRLPGTLAVTMPQESRNFLGRETLELWCCGNHGADGK